MRVLWTIVAYVLSLCIVAPVVFLIVLFVAGPHMPASYRNFLKPSSSSPVGFPYYFCPSGLRERYGDEIHDVDLLKIRLSVEK
jgi:hypothetical protein